MVPMHSLLESYLLTLRAPSSSKGVVAVVVVATAPPQTPPTRNLFNPELNNLALKKKNNGGLG
jgi:hypothetical protein